MPSLHEPSSTKMSMRWSSVSAGRLAPGAKGVSSGPRPVAERPLVAAAVAARAVEHEDVDAVVERLGGQAGPRREAHQQRLAALARIDDALEHLLLDTLVPG